MADDLTAGGPAAGGPLARLAAHPAMAVLEYHLIGYRRVWRGSALSSFLLPMLALAGFGLSVGHFIEQGVGGVRYLDWVVPGLLAATALNVAAGESGFPVFGGFAWTRIYVAQAATPLRVADILTGHLAFVVLRVLISGVPFLAVVAGAGAVRSLWALAVLPVLGLLGLAVAGPVHAYAATVELDGYLPLLFRFMVIPMSLFAGVFFPVGELPVGLRILAYVSPLWHAVDLCRAATLGVAPDWSAPGHLLYLAAWAAGGWWLARARFRRRLIV